MPDVIFRISAPTFTAGVIPGKMAGPIVKYMKDWTPERIRTYCKARGWKIEELDGRTFEERKAGVPSAVGVDQLERPIQ